MVQAHIIFLSYLIYFVYSEIVQHYPCDSEVTVASDTNVKDHINTGSLPESWECVVQEVRVSPCPAAQHDRNIRCNIKRGSVMQIEFDFTPANNYTVENEIHKVGSNRGYFSWHNWFHFSQNLIGHYNFNVTVDKSTLPVSLYYKSKDINNLAIFNIYSVHMTSNGD